MLCIHVMAIIEDGQVQSFSSFYYINLSILATQQG